MKAQVANQVEPGAQLLFLTGMQRSGTTLLDHLLHAHPDLSVLSQPFPMLFVDARAKFLRAAGGGAEDYPLGPMFRELTTSEQFTRFLVDYALVPGQLGGVFSRMADYSGQYTRPDEATVKHAAAHCPTVDFSAQLAHLYAAFSDRPVARWYGGKEVLCEAFVPYLLQRGARVMLMLRDPRDVLASLNHGEGGHWAGSPKPTLFNLRNWRKSAALALAFRDHPNFLAVRFEDLVADTAHTLAQALLFLGVSPTIDRVVQQGLASWQGNSSFGELHGVATAPVGRYRDVLPPEVTRFVEASCYPEMQVLNYHRTLAPERISDTIRSFVDPYPVQRASLQGYGATAQEVEAELSRLSLLSQPTDDERLDNFIFPGARRALARAFIPA